MNKLRRMICAIVFANLQLIAVAESQLGGVQLWENGPYWAECNVGASQPEEYGYYFWWGDTVGYTRSGGTWTDGYYYIGVTWLSSAGAQMSSSPFDKSTCPTYGKSNSQLQSSGYIDSTGNLVAAHDAATAHLGAPWRMPTDSEWAALIDNCTTVWTNNYNNTGVNGRLVTGKGAYCSKSIFLPAAGYGGINELGYPGSRADYWSSTQHSDTLIEAWDLYFGLDKFDRAGDDRHLAQSVRPIRDALTRSEWTDPSSGYTWKYSIGTTGGSYAYEYNLQSNEIEIGSGTESRSVAVSPNPSGSLVIPSAIGGRNVVTIGNGALEDTAITTVTIPQTVRYIGGWALSGTKITEVTIPNSVVYIGQKAFDGCRSLQSVNMSSNVVCIDWHAFDECAISSISLPDSLTSIGEDAFIGCANLTEVYVSHAHEERLVGLLRDSGFDISKITVRYIGDSPGPESYGPFVPGEVIEINTGLLGYTAKGLTAGLKYNTKSGKITGAATKPTGEEGVTVAFTKRGEPDEALTIIVGPLPAIAIAIEGETTADTDGCKVTGAGAYLVGKKVSLSATAPKGTAFLGWYLNGMPWPDAKNFRTAKLSYEMTKEDLSLTAKFEKEKMSVDCAAMASEWIAGVNCGNMAGDGIPLEIETQSGVKSVKVMNLPAGMKYEAKTGLITGAPTKSGPVTVKLEVTANSGAVTKKEITINVVAADPAVTGAFNGFAADESLYDFSRVGTLSFTAGADGKLSAKVTTAAGAYSFSASAWDRTDCDRYYSTMTTKKGERLVLEVATAGSAEGGWDKDQVAGEFLLADGTRYHISAQKTVFDRPWYFKAYGDELNGWTLVNWNDAKTADVTVTFSNGATKLSGKLGAYKFTGSGFVNMASWQSGILQADFAVVVAVGKEKRVLNVNTNLGFDRTPDAEVGNAGFAR